MKHIYIAIAFILLCGFTQQPLNERIKQEKLPVADGDVWQKLSKAKVDLDNTKGVFVAKVPTEVKALSGKQVSVSGFILPIVTGTKHSHFLLSKRTPTCPYCLPGGATEVIDIYLKEPVTYSDGMLFITGKFKFIDDIKNGMFFRIEDGTADAPSAPIEHFKDKNSV